MGTRGFVGFFADGKPLITYNHFDSYPSGVGVDVLRKTRAQMTEAPAALKKATRDLTLVSGVNEDDAGPTDEQLAAIVASGIQPDTNVGAILGTDGRVRQPSRPTWYQVLREVQGDPWGNLRAGFMIDNQEFAYDSLFCEWGYLIVLDGDGAFEVYKGFQTEDHDDGLWGRTGLLRKAGWSPEGQHTGPYYPVRRVASWPLFALPSDEEFVAGLEREDEDE